MATSYIAFISYKHIERDAAIAKKVHSLIENYIIPRELRTKGKKLGVVFRDEEELPISSDLSESIRSALDASRYLVVVCSPEAKASPWVSREIDYFLEKHDVKDVFVILANGEPADVFPYAITHVIDTDTSECVEIEPLALDVRAGTTRGSVEKLRKCVKKLYAAMIGCSYDSLVKREQVRRLKRILISAVIAILVAASIGTVILRKNRELSLTNAQLADANWGTLTRESQLLAVDAEKALVNGEHVDAIRGAIAALSVGDTEHPYNASAERTLFSALNIFGNEQEALLLNKLVISHKTTIDMMAFSADGSSLFVIDSYGNVNRYSTSTGESEWSAKLQEPQRYSRVSGSQIWIDSKANILVCCYKGDIAGIDAISGRILWNHPMSESMAYGVFFDEENQTIAYIEEIYTLSPDWSESSYAYNFVSVSSVTGLKTHSIELPSAVDPDRVYFPSDSKAISGAFAGENRFVGTLFRLENGICRSQLYIVDMQAETVTYVDNETYAEESDRYRYLQTIYTGKNQVLVISSGAQLHLKCFDIASCQMLWETTAGDDDTYISIDAECFTINWKTEILIAAGDFMCVVAREDGAVSASVGLFDSIVELYPVQSGLFGFHLANGYCAVGWVNDYGLHDSNGWGVNIDVPDSSLIIASNNGLIQPRISGNMIEGFEALPVQAGGGCIAYLSEDRCSAIVTTVLPRVEQQPFVKLKWNGDTVSYLGHYLDTNPINGNVLMGSVRISDHYGLLLIDVVNHEATVIDCGSTAASADYIHLTSDGKGIIAATKYGDIYYVETNGTVHVLAEDEKVTLSTARTSEGVVNFVTSKYQADSTRLEKNQSVISARCDGEFVTIWLDEHEDAKITVPKSVRWFVSDRSTRKHMFNVGENGLIMLSHYPSTKANALESFAVYSYSDQEWKMITDVAAGNEERLVAFGQTTSLFAVYDTDMAIRIYSWEKAKHLRTINTEIPANSVQQMEVILDDQYVYIATKDGQFTIYELSTGTIIYRASLSGYFSDDAFSVWYDEQNDRLYVRAGSGCLCIDVRMWEEVFRLKDTEFFAFYSVTQNEVYRTHYDYENYSSQEELEYLNVPSTSELIDIAKKIVE